MGQEELENMFYKFNWDIWDPYNASNNFASPLFTA